MNKHLIFSLLTTCLLVSPLTARDNENRDDAEENSNEFDLYERNEDGQDFDRYNFPNDQNYQKKTPSQNYQQQPDQRIPGYTARTDNHYNNDGRNQGHHEQYDQGKYNQNKDDKNINYDVQFYEEAGYNVDDFDPYFPDVQYKYDEVLEQNKSHPYYDNARNYQNKTPSSSDNNNNNNNPSTPNYNYQNNPTAPNTPKTPG